MPLQVKYGSANEMWNNRFHWVDFRTSRWNDLVLHQVDGDMTTWPLYSYLYMQHLIARLLGRLGRKALMRFMVPYSAVQWRENYRTTSRYAGEGFSKSTVDSYVGGRDTYSTEAKWRDDAGQVNCRACPLGKGLTPTYQADRHQSGSCTRTDDAFSSSQLKLRPRIMPSGALYRNSLPLF